MAVVYSWKLGSNNYGYIVKPKEHNKALVIRGGEPLSGSDLNDVRDWASTIDVTNQGDRKVYETQLERLKAEIRANGLNVELASADDYLNMEGDCADLRGPAGPRGPKGDPGEPGRVGDRGPMGPVGPRGKSEMDMMFVTLYYASDNIANGPASAPNEPYDTDDPGPVYDFDNNKLIIPAGGNCAGWDENDEKPGFLWKTDRMFYKAEKYDRTKSWSKPMRITPKDGEPGADGVNIEFVYHVEPNDVTGKEPAMPSRQISGSKNWISEDGNVIWNDHPAGISENQKIEWMCCRVKDEKGEWGVWEGPSIWSRWGDNGQDGDGVEYIYHRNNGTGIRPIDSPSSISPEEAGFQDSDYLPGVNGLYKGRQWTDEPKGVEAEFEKSFEWVCVRKKVNGKWEAFSNPKLWSHYGEKGDNGNSIVMKYAVSDGVEEMPPINQESNNPGSNWNGSVKNLLKAYRPGENVLWGTQALVNYKGELLKDENGDPIPWEDPFLLTGKNGVTPSYKMYFFHLEEEDENGKKKAPAAPDGIHSITDNDLNNLESQGWIDYPDKPGVWYQIVATIDGITKKVGKWGSVQPLTGVGTGLEVRFKKTETRVKASEVEINVTERYPGEGWYLPDDPKADFDIVEDQTLWESMVHLDRNDNMLDNWCTPFPVSGERGPQGEQGATGPQGIPGAGYSLRYKLGPDSIEKWPDGFWIEEWSGFMDVEQHGWTKVQPKIKNTTSKDRMYIWAIQARTHFEMLPSPEDPSKMITREVFDKTDEDWGWSDPFLTSGVNGIDGTPGKKAPVIYPEGVYDPDKVYYATDKKAPYVYDSSTGEYFVLNYVEDGWGWWGGSTGHTGTEVKEIITPEGKVLTAPTQKGKTPAEMYVEGYSNYWEMFEQFDAVYAKVGIIANGLIGEAVFNNEFMFSQKGVKYSENAEGELTYTSRYEDFLNKYTYTREKGYVNNITKEPLGFDEFVEDLDKENSPEFYVSNASYAEEICINYSCGKKSVEWTDDDIYPKKRIGWLPGSIIVLGIPCSSDGVNKGKYFMSYQTIVDRNTLRPLYATDTPEKDKDYWICEDGKFTRKAYIQKSPDPYGPLVEGGNETCDFFPNICINFSTGEMWLAAGGMYIDSEGNTSWGKYKWTKNPLDCVFDDKIISVSEKIMLSGELSKLLAEKNQLITEAEKYISSKETSQDGYLFKNLNGYYDELLNYFKGVLEVNVLTKSTKLPSDFNVEDYKEKYENYKTAFEALAGAIDAKINTDVINLARDGSISEKDAVELKGEQVELEKEFNRLSSTSQNYFLKYEKDNVSGKDVETKHWKEYKISWEGDGTDNNIGLNKYITSITNGEYPISVDPKVYTKYFTSYYEARDVLESKIDNILENISNDSVISMSEKPALQNIWAEIKLEYSKFISREDISGKTTNYETAYNNLYAFLHKGKRENGENGEKPIYTQYADIDNTKVDSQIEKNTYKEVFSAYYDEKNKILALIEEKINESIGSINTSVTTKLGEFEKKLSLTEQSLEDMSSDGKITRIEQQALKVLFDDIKSDYNDTISQDYGVDTNGITNAFTELNRYLTGATAIDGQHTDKTPLWFTEKELDLSKYPGYDSEDPEITGNGRARFTAEFNTYFSAREKFIKLVETEKVEKIDAAFSDGKLSPSDKRDLSIEYEDYKRDNEQLIALYNSYSGVTIPSSSGTSGNTYIKKSTYDAYISAWNSLSIKDNGYIVKCLKNPSIETVVPDSITYIDETTKEFLKGIDAYKKEFGEYYSKRDLLLKEINLAIDGKMNIIENKIPENADDVSNLLKSLGPDGETEIKEKGLVLTNLIGVRDNKEGQETKNIKAFMNGSSSFSEKDSEDPSKVRVLNFAAGIPDPASENDLLENRCHNSAARIYSDGTTYLANGTAYFNPDGSGHLGKEYEVDGKLTGEYPIQWKSGGSGLTVSQRTLGHIKVNSLNTVPDNKTPNNQIIISGNTIEAYSDADSIGETKGQIYKMLSIKGTDLDYVRYVDAEKTVKLPEINKTENITVEEFDETESSSTKFSLGVAVSGSTQDFDWVDSSNGKMIIDILDSITTTPIFRIDGLNGIESAKKIINDTGTSRTSVSASFKNVISKEYNGVVKNFVIAEGHILPQQFNELNLSTWDELVSWFNKNFLKYGTFNEKYINEIIDFKESGSFLLRCKVDYNFTINGILATYASPTTQEEIERNTSGFEVFYDLKNDNGLHDLKFKAKSLNKITEIGKNGFRVIYDGSSYMEFDGEQKSFIMHTNGNEIKCNSGGASISNGNYSVLIKDGGMYLKTNKLDGNGHKTSSYTPETRIGIDPNGWLRAIQL